MATTFNPTPYNFVTWAMAPGTPISFAVLAALILLLGYIIYLRATLRSIGAFGMLLVAGLVASLLWVAYDLGWLSLENRAVNTWIGIFAISFVLGVGLCWSIVRRRLSGQADVDDVNA